MDGKADVKFVLYLECPTEVCVAWTATPCVIGADVHCARAGARAVERPR